MLYYSNPQICIQTFTVFFYTGMSEQNVLGCSALGFYPLGPTSDLFDVNTTSPTMHYSRELLIELTSNVNYLLDLNGKIMFRNDAAL